VTTLAKVKNGPRPSISGTSTPVQPPLGVRGPWYVGDPEHCREMDDSPDDPGVANAWDSSGERGAFGGEPSRGA